MIPKYILQILNLKYVLAKSLAATYWKYISIFQSILLTKLLSSIFINLRNKCTKNWCIFFHKHILSFGTNIVNIGSALEAVVRVATWIQPQNRFLIILVSKSSLGFGSVLNPAGKADTDTRSRRCFLIGKALKDAGTSACASTYPLDRALD